MVFLFLLPSLTIHLPLSVRFMGVLEKFLTFPMPTVAAINGHAFAGGFLLSLCHDYRTFQSNRGFLCMNEIDMPAAMNPGLLSVLEAKLPTARDYRDVMLYGTRFPAGEAFKRGFIDAAGKDGAETIKLAKELGLKFASKARAGMIMGLLKDEVVGFQLRPISRNLARSMTVPTKFFPPNSTPRPRRSSAKLV